MDKNDKVEIYDKRREAKRLIKLVEASLMPIAEDRYPKIREYFQLLNDTRGKTAGLTFNKETLCVDVWWNYYEGISTRVFPQTLLWSNKPLDELREEKQQNLIDYREKVKADKRKKLDELLDLQRRGEI